MRSITSIMLILCWTFVPILATGDEATDSMPPRISSWTPELTRNADSSNQDRVESDNLKLSLLDLTYLNDIRKLYGYRGPGIKVRHLPPPDLITLTKHLLSWDLVAKEAKADGYTISEQEASNTIAGINSHEGYSVAARYIAPFETTATNEELRLLYEEFKDPLLKQEESLEMGLLTFPNFYLYKVKSDSTLEELILQEGLDTFQASGLKEIKENETMVMGEAEGSTLIGKGTHLLIPFPEERRATNAARAEEASLDLVNGKKWEDVTEEFKLETEPVRIAVYKPSQMKREMNPRIREAFLNLEDGDFSKPIETENGYHIVYRVNYTPDGYLTLKESEARLRNIYKGRQREKLYMKLILDVFEKSEGAVFYEDRIFSPETEGSEIVLKLMEQEMTYDELDGFMEGELRRGEAEHIDDVLQYLVRLPSFLGLMRRAILTEYDPELGKKLTEIRRMTLDTVIAEKYLEEKSEQLWGERGGAEGDIDRGRKIRELQMIKAEILDPYFDEVNVSLIN